MSSCGLWATIWCPDLPVNNADEGIKLIASPIQSSWVNEWLKVYIHFFSLPRKHKNIQWLLCCQCSVTCGTGRRQRSITCMDASLGIPVSKDYCTKAVYVATEEFCTRPACASWRVGDWRPCSVSCGKVIAALLHKYVHSQRGGFWGMTLSHLTCSFWHFICLTFLYSSCTAWSWRRCD